MSVRHSWHQFTRTGERVRERRYLYKNENKMETIFFANSRSVLEKGKGPLDISCIATVYQENASTCYASHCSCADLCLVKDLTCVASCVVSYRLHSFSQILACLTASHNVEKSCCNVWHFVVFLFFYELTTVTIVSSRLHVCMHVCGKLCA